MACEQEIERAIAAKARCCSAGATCRPTTAGLSERTKEVEPVIRQVFIAPRHRTTSTRTRSSASSTSSARSRGHAIQALQLRHGKEFYVPSMSTRTIVYKGMLLAHQVGEYYLDLPIRVDGVGAGDGAPALLDQHVPDVGPRASVPSASATTARSTRCAATSTGSARGSRAIASTVLGDDLDKIWPLIYDGQSDSASFDNALELLRDGRLSARARDDADDPGGVGRAIR